MLQLFSIFRCVPTGRWMERLVAVLGCLRWRPDPQVQQPDPQLRRQGLPWRANAVLQCLRRPLHGYVLHTQCCSKQKHLSSVSQCGRDQLVLVTRRHIWQVVSVHFSFPFSPAEITPETDRRNCWNIKAPENGFLTPTSAPEGTVVRVGCLPGYERTGGPARYGCYNGQVNINATCVHNPTVQRFMPFW